MTELRKKTLVNVKKVLIKIGSAVLTGHDGLDLKIIDRLVDEMAGLAHEGYQIVIVTSGAIASGRHRMGIEGPVKSMPQKQALAAIGQGRLMRVYSNAFGRHNLYTAQILLTMSDLTDRKRYLNVRNTLSTLIDWGVTAIVNENDTVSVDEIKFGDNDHLAAMIANVIDADLVINLTATDGLYDRNPSHVKKASLIKIVSEITEDIEAAATEDTSSVGSGGMKSKILSAKKVTACGIPYVIAPGKKKGILRSVISGNDTGTLFLPTQERMHSRKYWIAFALRPKGKIAIDDGAKKAIIEDGKSLLPSGILSVDGDFEIGDPVTCIDAKGTSLASGLVNYSSSEILKIMGLKSTKIAQVLGYKDYDEVIHRDNLAITRPAKKIKS